MNPSSLWRPLHTTVLRNLLVANVISDIGTFMQRVGAAWLMVSLGAGPMYIALTQTASSLPFFLLALPAGSAGDIIDRRKLILFTQGWVVCVAIALAVLALAGLMSARAKVCALRRRCLCNTHIALRSSRGIGDRLAATRL